MKHVRSGLYLLVLFSAALYNTSARGVEVVGEKKPLTCGYVCQNPRAIDGDTVACDIETGLRGVVLYGERVRLYGIDTPELHSKDPKERRAAEYAQEALARHLKEGQVKLYFRGDRQSDQTDKYGRMLGYLFAGDININKEMLLYGAKYFGGKRGEPVDK